MSGFDDFTYKNELLEIMKELKVPMNLRQQYLLALRFVIENSKLDQALQKGSLDNLELFGSKDRNDIRFWRYILAYYKTLEIDILENWSDK